MGHLRFQDEHVVSGRVRVGRQFGNGWVIVTSHCLVASERLFDSSLLVNIISRSRNCRYHTFYVADSFNSHLQKWVLASQQILEMNLSLLFFPFSSCFSMLLLRPALVLVFVA